MQPTNLENEKISNQSLAVIANFNKDIFKFEDTNDTCVDNYGCLIPIEDDNYLVILYRFGTILVEPYKLSELIKYDENLVVTNFKVDKDINRKINFKIITYEDFKKFNFSDLKNEFIKVKKQFVLKSSLNNI